MYADILASFEASSEMVILQLRLLYLVPFRHFAILSFRVLNTPSLLNQFFTSFVYSFNKKYQDLALKNTSYHLQSLFIN